MRGFRVQAPTNFPLLRSNPKTIKQKQFHMLMPICAMLNAFIESFCILSITPVENRARNCNSTLLVISFITIVPSLVWHQGA